MKIVKAEISDAQKLIDLAIQSKSYWDYSEIQIEEWRNELTVTANYIKKNVVFKLCSLKKIA